MGVTAASALAVLGALQLVAGAVVLAFVLAGPGVAIAVGLLLAGALSAAAGLFVVQVPGGERR